MDRRRHAAWSLLFLDEYLGTPVWSSIAVSVPALLVMPHTTRGNDKGRALPWTLLPMLAINVYSLSDKATEA